MNPDINHIEAQCWSYLDGILPQDEKAMVEKLIQTEAVWKAKYEELKELHEMVQSSELEAPSMRFTKNVMEEIGRLSIAPASKKYINNKIIWGISFFFIALLVGFLVYGFGQTDWSAGSSSDDFTKKLSQVDYSKFFSNAWVNAFMMINIILGLFLFDNYLGMKRKQFRKGA